MALTLAPEKIISWNQRLITWSGGTAPYYIYKYGQLIGVTHATEFTVMVGAGEHPVIEVRDDTGTPARGYPREVEFQWGRGTAIEYYVVQKYVDSSWDEVARIYDNGEEYFQYRSGFLADCTVHQYRVLPYGTNGNAGTAKTWSILVIGYPNVPDVTYTYDSGTGKFTSAAS